MKLRAVALIALALVLTACDADPSTTPTSSFVTPTVVASVESTTASTETSTSSSPITSETPAPSTTHHVPSHVPSVTVEPEPTAAAPEPTHSSGIGKSPGAFCSKAEHGSTEPSKDGGFVTCTKDSSGNHWRWR